MQSLKPEWDAEFLGGNMELQITNPALLEERAKCTFNQEEVERFLMGDGYEEMKGRERMHQQYPELLPTMEYEEMTRIEKMEDWWRRYHRGMEVGIDKYWKNGHPILTALYSRTIEGTGPLDLHHAMFTTSMKLFTNPEQKAKYLPITLNTNIIGAYAQSELAHGSNLQALETTATLDMATDEFVIHTPTIRATKVWMGSMGIMATHVVLFSRIVANGKDYGPQPLIVQIRSLEDHMPLPGIEVGDLGEKLGYASMDNGYLIFDQARIPRTNLLSRFVEVTKEGKLIRKGDPRLLY